MLIQVHLLNAKTQPVFVAVQLQLNPPMADVLALLCVHCLERLVRVEEKASCLACFSPVLELSELDRVLNDVETCEEDCYVLDGCCEWEPSELKAYKVVRVDLSNEVNSYGTYSCTHVG